MSIKIKKQTGEIFDLPPDYIIESEKNNPLFSNRGSQSVPIAFPNSPGNLKLLEHANRIDRGTKTPAGIPVAVESGPVQQAGLMIINSASGKAISASIGYDESEMYASMGTTQLRNMKNLPVFTAGGTTVDTRVDAMMTHLTAVMKEQIEADYFIFPAVIKIDIEEKDGIKTTHYEILNDYVKRLKITPSNGEMGELKALNARILPRYIDSGIILFDVPKGYGVSPFLKVWRIIELIFETHFGWTLASNPFKEHRQLKRLVVLNNTIDTVLTGRLHYKDMMPDITVKEFLDALYNKFGLQYFVNSTTRTVSLVFWKDIFASLKSPGQIDLTGYKTSPLTINYTQNKQLRLAANREIEGTSVPFNTFEEFLTKYNWQFKDIFHGDPSEDYSSFFDPNRNYTIRFMKKFRIKVSSDFFDWDKKADLPYEEIKMTDLCLPLEPAVSGSTGILSYPVGYNHAWSDVSISGAGIEEKQNTAKLAFAFGWGKTNMQDTFLFEYFFASQDNRNELGKFIHDPSGVRYDLSLTCHREDGLFNRFWKEYDAFLRHSAYRVDARLKLPETEIIRMKMYQPVFMDNQPLLPEQISFKQNKPDAVSDCKFKTVRLYEPYDLAVEQSIVEYHPQLYFWQENIIYSPNIEEWLISQGIPYTIEDMPGEEGSNRQPLLLLPPTENEFINQFTRTSVFNYIVLYRDGGINYNISVTRTAIYIPALIL